MTSVGMASVDLSLSVPQAAERLGISKDLAYALTRRGELPGAFRIGRRWRVSAVRLALAVHGSRTAIPSKPASLAVPGLDGMRVVRVSVVAGSAWPSLPATVCTSAPDAMDVVAA